MAVPWERVSIAGRTAEIFQPTGTPAAAVIWLHDLDGRSFQGHGGVESAFAAAGLVVVCPSGGAGWWLDRPTPGFESGRTPARHVLDEVVPWVEQTWGIAPPRVGLAGVGMGGQGAINLGFRHARRFPVVAALLPDVDFHQWHGRGLPLDALFTSREAARQETATLHLHPLNWPRRLLLCCDPGDVRFEGTERLASKLYSSGVPFEADFEIRSPGEGGSYLDQLAPRVAQFLGEHLRNVLPL